MEKDSRRAAWEEEEQMRWEVGARLPLLWRRAGALALPPIAPSGKDYLAVLCSDRCRAGASRRSLGGGGYRALGEVPFVRSSGRDKVRG